jgi:propionate CoA-transferase
MQNKIISAEDAIRLIRSGDTITTAGFVGTGVPEALLKALKAQFLKTGTPRDLKLVFAAGQGDGGERGLNHLGYEGLIAEAIGGHWGLIPKLARLAIEGKLLAYNFPQGVISQNFREIAAGRPGLVTRVGLHTFVDPRVEGGKIGPGPQADIVELTTLSGEEYLFYPARRIDVALLRGSTADTVGNITMENEALTLDSLAQAMAVKNSGGAVIVQVERSVARGALNPRHVQIPGALVDAVVVADPADHPQTFGTQLSHAFTGAFRVEADTVTTMALDCRKVIARRAACELPVNGIVNLGIGMPEGVAAVAAEERLLDHITLTTEPGVIGGQPASGRDFGAAINTDAVIPQNMQFDFYDGGGLDLAILGMAELDRSGSVNVSRFGSRLAGSGGFINISQNASALVFTGTFTSVGLDTKIDAGKLVIRAEGKTRKCVDRIGQVTFLGTQAAEQGKPVLYVTERCVFSLTPKGLELIEVAPGIDIERDILAQMDFTPIINDPAQMDLRIFVDEPMGLDVDLLYLDIDHRIAIDADRGHLFVNFEKLRVRTSGDIALIRKRIETVCAPLPGRVDVVVNYDDTRIDPDIEREFASMVSEMESRFYGTVSRFSGSAFMRMKLADILQRDVAPHIFESAEEARNFLDRTQ